MKKNGDLVVIHVSISKVEDKNGVIINYVGTMFDITHFKKTENELKDIAKRDSLTKLLNRNTLLPDLKELLRRADLNGSKTALLFLDLDKFKLINDTYGHEIGDVVLVEFTKNIQKVFSSIAKIYRYGGDEFVLIIGRYISREWLVGYIEEFNSVLSHGVVINETVLQVECSVGISISPEDTNRAKELIKYADEAMYSAKNLSNQSYSFYISNKK